MKTIKNYTDFLKEANTNVTGGNINWESDMSNGPKKVTSDELEEIHFKLKDMLTAKDFDNVKSFMEQYNTDDTDPNILKTILVITKSFENNETLKNVRKEMVERLNKKGLMPELHPVTDTPNTKKGNW